MSPFPSVDSKGSLDNWLQHGYWDSGWMNPICKDSYNPCKLPKLSFRWGCQQIPPVLACNVAILLRRTCGSVLSAVRVVWDKAKHSDQTFHTGSLTHSTKHALADLLEHGEHQQLSPQKHLQSRSSWGIMAEERASMASWMLSGTFYLHCGKGPRCSVEHVLQSTLPEETCMTLVYLSTECHTSGASHIHF